MRTVLICLMGVLLTGCAQQIAQQKRDEAGKIMMAEIKECFEGEELNRQNALKRIDCKNAARMKFGLTINSPNMWVLEENLAADRESAVKYSEGKISKEEYKTELQKHYADGAAIDAQATQQSHQQNIQNLMAVQGMLPKPQPAPQPYMMPTTPTINTNCNAYGSTINCTSR